MKRLFQLFNKTETEKTNETKDFSIKIKNSEERQFISSEDLFISESGYAYSIKDIVSRIKKIKSGPRDVTTPGFNQGAKGILCDYKNKENYADYRHNNQFFQNFDVERNTLFSIGDMQKLCQLPEIKEALVEACKGEGYYDQLLESSFHISEETLNKMEKLVKKAILFDHPVLKMSEAELGSILNEPILDMLKHINLLGEKNPEIMSFNTIEQIMRENMQKSYQRNNTLIKDLRIITKQNKESESASCAAGFYQEFSNLYGIIVTFKRYGQAIGYRPDADLEEQKDQTSTSSLRKTQDS